MYSRKRTRISYTFTTTSNNIGSNLETFRRVLDITSHGNLHPNCLGIFYYDNMFGMSSTTFLKTPGC